MQQETPQVGPPQTPPSSPVLPSPSVPPTPSSAPEEQPFYQPAEPEAYVGGSIEAPHAFSPASPAAAPQSPAPDSVTWEASEYVHTAKGGLWLTVFVAVVAIAAGIALWFGAWTFVILIVVMGAAMGVFAFRPPRTLRYILTNAGVQIADKLYPYTDFRAFGVLEDGAFFTMTLIPVKRFSPALSVYFAEAEGEQIVDMVGDHLPMEHIQADAIDKLMRRLHF